MSLDAQTLPPDRHLRLYRSPTAASGAEGGVHDLASCASELGEATRNEDLPRVRGESAILRLLQEQREMSNTVIAEPKVVEAAAEEPERVLLTFLFTDIVASTEAVERLGDHAWCMLLLRHHAIVRGHLNGYRGREIDAAGDGFFLVFDRPSLALQFATTVRAALKAIGIGVRMGVHTGECEMVAGRVEGVAVHTAARVASAAGDGEILVSNTVRDLLAGSGLRFAGRSLQVLKGLSEPRQLFALTT